MHPKLLISTFRLSLVHAHRIMKKGLKLFELKRVSFLWCWHTHIFPLFSPCKMTFCKSESPQSHTKLYLFRTLTFNFRHPYNKESCRPTRLVLLTVKVGTRRWGKLLTEHARLLFEGSLTSFMW